MNDRKNKIGQALTVMATSWGITMDAPRLKIYMEALADLPIGAIEKAIGHLIKTRTFAGNIPLVAEIREAAEEFLAEEHNLLPGPSSVIVVTAENCHKYADKNCLNCDGKGKTEKELPRILGEGIVKVEVCCDCVDVGRKD